MIYILTLQSLSSTNWMIIDINCFWNFSLASTFSNRYFILTNKLTLICGSFPLDSLMNNGVIYYPIYSLSKNTANLVNCWAKVCLISMFFSRMISLKISRISMIWLFSNKWHMLNIFWMMAILISGSSSCRNSKTNGSTRVSMLLASKLIQVCDKLLINILLTLQLLSLTNVLIKLNTLLLYFWMFSWLVIYIMQGGINALI